MVFAMSAPACIEFGPLKRFPWLVHGFTLRPSPGEVDLDSAEAKLTPRQVAVLRTHGIAVRALALAEQVHGAEVAVVESGGGAPWAGMDGLATMIPGVALGIHVADCCAIYLVDPAPRAIAMLHSGKKGTAGGIPATGVATMVRAFGSDPGKLVAALGPCIHACCYDLDFVADIERQLAEEGVREVWRHPDCTACHPELYDSYRRDQGQTGRMLAFMMVQGP